MLTANLNFMQHLFQVDDRGLSIEVPHRLIGTFVPDQLTYPTLFIHQVSKRENTDGAGLHAGGLYLTITDLSVLIPRPLVGFLNPLNAEGTFFHDPFASYGDIGIQLEIEGFGPFPIKPVKAPHLIRTVLGTKAGTNATIIYLVVNPLLGVVGCEYRAHGLAGSIIAVLAKHGEKD